MYKVFQKNSKFEWNKECGDAFTNAKHIIACDKALVHYDRNALLILVFDAAMD